MDIVDTFNHLIPTEHLDDAIFLGSNLESEGCDEFSTSQNVLEDSLKNMLSDKDPMLGSASTQFCLPVLDNMEPNFQIPPTSSVDVDEIMDVGIDKVTSVDINDGDLILPNKIVNILPVSSIKSPRKSPRLKVQESSRTLKQSTTEKSLNPVKVTSPKKVKSSRKDTVTDQVKDDEHTVHVDDNDLRGIAEHVQFEKDSVSPLNSRRSTRLANKELKEKAIADEKNVKTEMAVEYSNAINDILSNTQCILEITDDSKAVNEDHFMLLSKNTEKAETEMEGQCLKNFQADPGLGTPIEDRVIHKEICQPTNKKSDIIYDKVHQELALLSGVECNLSVKRVVHPETNDESIMPNSNTAGQGNCDADKYPVTSEILHSTIKHSSDVDMSDPQNTLHNQKGNMDIGEKGNVTGNEMSLQSDACGKPSHNQKSTKKTKPNSAKLHMSSKHTKKILASKDGSFNTRTQKGKIKTNKVPVSELESQPKSLKSVKFKKIRESVKVDKVALKHKLKKKSYLMEKEGNPSILLKRLGDLKDNEGGLKETVQAAPSHAFSKSLSHSIDKSVTKHALSKTVNQAKDVEHRETADHLEEKSKLKKSFPPRQRRISKSISVEEPQLFIPDNIPTVKKEGAEVTSATDKYVWNPTRHCSSCRKLHGNRFMVGCGRCDDWFHGECVGLSLAQAQQMEADDKEYICVKCCAEEEKMEATEAIVSVDNQNMDPCQDVKTVETDKPMTIGCPGLSHEKQKQVDDVKHKVKISKKSSGDNRYAPENRNSEIKKHAFNRKSLQPATAFHCTSEERHDKPSKDSTTTLSHDERTPKTGVNEKQEIKRKKPERKGSSSSGIQTSSPSTPKPSVDQIRQSVRQSLKDILVKRLSESTSKIPEERATKVSARIEKELFSFYRDTESKYKNKYRSLMFNLKDPKNNILYKRVLRGEITPEHLIKMTPEELASRELAAWRQRENRHTIEMIEKEQREVERRPITKITHKGEIEIESEAPMKEPEAMDTQEPIIKPVEKEEEVQKDKDTPVESTSDTTAQHKNHLFDLNCKICTGRMAPPAEDLSPKKVKVSPGLFRKQSENEAENLEETSSFTVGSLNVDVLEPEKAESPKEPFFSTSSSESFSITDTAEDESTFLSRLTYIWKGFLNMPSVAKFVIKAYPVSGTLEHLTEDLPDSIQVGGRISPQTVWDYVEKIRASGTKETCVIRFSPETEEDQISYTLLYSYFSSRKRYGVVANNMRQVKDMYLIPLGASEKIPHFFVPFDGPGLEARRPNLLLALIIRQKLKRQHSTSLDEEHIGTSLSIPEKMGKIEAADDGDEEDEENDFFNSFTTVLHKNRNRSQLSDTDEPQTVAETVPEAIKREPPKPLRFLPGVLVGWENPHSALDLANKPLPVDDILQSLLGTTESVFERKPTLTLHADKSLKEEKAQVVDQIFIAEESFDKNMEIDTKPSTVDDTKEHSVPLMVSLPDTALGVSLKDKPPDVSTEVYLTKINAHSSEESLDNGLTADLDDFKQETEKPENTNLLSEILMNKDDSNLISLDVTTSPVKSLKLLHIKRDPRQAAGRSHINSSDDLSKDEVSPQQNKESPENISRHKKDRTRKHSREETDQPTSKSDRSKISSLFPSPKQNETDDTESSKPENSKTFPADLLIDDTDPLQQFRRALAANKSQTQSSNITFSETPGNTPALAANLSALRLPQPPFLPLNSNPPAFPFQHNPSFPLQANPMFPYAPNIPPLLPTPLGIGFPRPPRFQAVESTIHNPLVAWHPTLQLARQPPHFFGHVTGGPLLGTEQVKYQAPQKLYHKDHRGQERRHSDPWDKQDRLSERSFSRGSRSEHRERFYSESHQSRDKRHEKESGSDKLGDKDSERSRRRDRDKERSHDRDRKIRDEPCREKERSRTSHDKPSDSKTSKEGRNSDKSKIEDRVHDKEKGRERKRDRDEEKDKHHRERSRDRSDKSKR